MVDPAHPYAARFVEVLARRGVSTVVLVTDPVAWRRDAWRFPVLGSPAVVARYEVEGEDLAAAARVLAGRHHVVGVVPFAEPAVLPSARLAEMLGLSWAQPVVLERFRDKAAMKRHLSSVPNGPRVNRSRLVRSVADVVAAARPDEVGSRFVLKPNDGYGNSRVGFFSADTAVEDINTFLSGFDGHAVLMEEFVAGEEFFVNGQVDAAGEVVPLAVFRYRREPANGRPNVQTQTRLVRTFEPEFPIAVAYARQVVSATGLRRSPFHLELLIDDQGPCLVEVAARLGGGDNAFDMEILHGSLDVFDLAAHHYVSADPYGPVPLDWERYDGRAYRKLLGVAVREERIRRTAGVRQVEQLPGFVRWVTRPRVGDRVVPTVDILHLPWHVVLEAETEAELDARSWLVRNMLRWNEGGGRLEQWVRGVLALTPALGRRLRSRLAARRLAPEPLPAPAVEPLLTSGGTVRPAGPGRATEPVPVPAG